MKYLTIKNSQGYYSVSPGTLSEKPIDQITKEDLLKLLELCVADDFEMDQYDAKKIKNAAHQIIYKNIYQKLDGFNKQRESFKDEKVALYIKAITEYSIELSELGTEISK